MSVLTLPTREFVGLLADAVLTAGKDPDLPLLATILLDTDRGEIILKSDDEGDTPLIDTVVSDLLVATSTDGISMVGQGHTACTGRFHRPVLIARLDAEALVKVFTPLAKTAQQNVTHQVQVEIAGDTLEVAEDPEQRPNGVVVQCRALDLDDYPKTLPLVMQPDVTQPVIDDGTEIPPSYGSGLGALAFETIGKVGKRRKMPTAYYRHHQRRGVVVEVGSKWRGLFMPTRLEEAEGQHLGPQVRVFEPRLPARTDASVAPPLPV